MIRSYPFHAHYCPSCGYLHLFKNGRCLSCGHKLSDVIDEIHPKKRRCQDRTLTVSALKADGGGNAPVKTEAINEQGET